MSQTQCSRCIVDTACCPGMAFDAQGLCSHCVAHDRKAQKRARKPANFGTPEELATFFDEIRGQSAYDCLVPYSGGKDGSQLLDLLRNEYRLRVLAYTYDTGFASEQTWRNLRQVPRAIGVDHIIIAADGRLTQDLFPRLVEKTGEICVACEMFLYAFALRLALDQRIPAIAWGITGLQLEQKCVFQGIVRDTSRSLGTFHAHYGRILEDLYADDPAVAKAIVTNYFPICADGSALPAAVYPFAILGYDIPTIEENIASFGWRRPTDTGGISSNCGINRLHIALQKRLYGKDQYAARLSAKMNEEGVSPEVASRALHDAPSDDELRAMLDSLGITRTVDELVTLIQAQELSPDLQLELKISI